MTDHVKIYGIKPRIQYTADGTLTVYEFPFAIFHTSDIDVYFGDVLQDTSTYTVSEARHSDGGSVTFESAPASGTIITIVRNLSIERTSDFQEGSTLRAKVLNDELDYQIACQQQIAENLNRSMVLPPYAADSGLDLTLPTPSAGKAIIWNSDGTNLENSEVEINAISRELDAKVSAATTQAGIATTAAETATTKAQLATTQAGIATTKAQIATDKATEAINTLANKADKDMNDLTTTGKTTVVNMCSPRYASGVAISSPYTASMHGFITLGIEGTTGSNASTLQVSINNHAVAYVGGRGSDGGPRQMVFFPVSNGDVISWTIANTTKAYCNFYPMKGVSNA